MADADFYVGWMNSTGGYTVSRRVPTGYAMPNPSSSQNAIVVPLQIRAPDWATLAFSFSRPIQVPTGKSLTADSPFIYALADTVPSNIDSIQSSFTSHREFGDLPRVNFLSVVPQTTVGSASSKAVIPSTPDVYEKVLLAHGILFFIAWGLIPFAGIFIARFLKKRLGHLWYKLHLGLFLGGTGLLSLVSFILILLYKRPDHFDSKHTVIGLIVFIAMILQIALGFIINALWDPSRSGPSVLDQVHWWFGRFLFLLALANIYLGILEFNELGYMSECYLPMLISFSVFIGLGCIALVFGQIKFGQTREYFIDFRGRF